MRILSLSQVFCKSKTIFKKPTLAATGRLDRRGKKEGLIRVTSGAEELNSPCGCHLPPLREKSGAPFRTCFSSYLLHHRPSPAY